MGHYKRYHLGSEIMLMVPKHDREHENGYSESLVHLFDDTLGKEGNDEVHMDSTGVDLSLVKKTRYHATTGTYKQLQK
jgi:hypothetical protein